MSNLKLEDIYISLHILFETWDFSKVKYVLLLKSVGKHHCSGLHLSFVHRRVIVSVAISIKNSVLR